MFHPTRFQLCSFQSSVELCSVGEEDRLERFSREGRASSPSNGLDVEGFSSSFGLLSDTGYGRSPSILYLYSQLSSFRSKIRSNGEAFVR